MWMASGLDAVGRAVPLSTSIHERTGTAEVALGVAAVGGERPDLVRVDEAEVGVEVVDDLEPSLVPLPRASSSGPKITDSASRLA